MMKTMKTLTVALLFALLAACQTTSERLVTEEGAVPFTKAEVEAFLSGRTEKWSEGAGYYAPDGTLKGRWRGEQFAGTWTATDSGAVCYHVAEWGTTPCTDYFRKGEQVVTVYKNRMEESHASDYMDGDQTAQF